MPVKVLARNDVAYDLFGIELEEAKEYILNASLGSTKQSTRREFE